MIKRTASMILCCIIVSGSCSGCRENGLKHDIESSGLPQMKTEEHSLEEEMTNAPETESAGEMPVDVQTKAETLMQNEAEAVLQETEDTCPPEFVQESTEMHDSERYTHPASQTIRDSLTENATEYPLVFTDETCSIIIDREWFEDAWVYAAHLQFTDYSRLATACANGAYDNGYETTSHAAGRLGAVFAVNGCYSAPYLNYIVVREGTIWNGAERNLWLPAVYSSHNGLLLSAWETGGTPGITGGNVDELVANGLITDTFCFGPPGMQSGLITDVSMTGARAQRTFIGTNGSPGDIWICVSDGRYNDGESAGLLGNQCMRFLKSKGCTFGVNLDGGGSSAMYFDGEILNAVRGNERAVVDFLYFK